jgi:putative ABC transport system substrate-binding protein
MFCIRRRQFIALFGGAVAWPIAVRGQQAATPVVGYLYSGSPETSAPWVAAFRKGLSEQGFTEGRNVAIEYRWANNEPGRLRELADDLVRRRVSIIVAPGTSESVLAAKAATSAIPIVFRTGGDPVALGLVEGINRPGGNVTGINALSLETVTKRLGLLHELLPKAARVAVLLNPNDPNAGAYTKELEAAAVAMGRQLDFFGASTIREIDAAFSDLAKKRPGGLLVVAQGLLSNRRVQIVTQATRHMLPGAYPQRDFVEIGGLMSYGPSSEDQFRLTGIYTGRILKGEKPADLPVLRASKFEFVINVQTARILEIEIPTTLLASADEVIE